MAKIVGFAGGAFISFEQGGGDTTPDAFAFTDQTEVTPSSVCTSHPITVSGIDAPAAISVSGGDYSINGGAFTSAPGSVSNADQVRARVTASASWSTGVTATVTIDTVSDGFTATTSAAPGSPTLTSKPFRGRYRLVNR
jgi:hypothetical protein